MQEIAKRGYASAAEANREAINRFIMEEQTRSLVNVLESRILIDNYNEFVKHTKSARVLIVNTDPEEALAEKKPLTVTALGVNLGGIELSIRHILHLEQNEGFIKETIHGAEEKDSDGDLFVKTTQFLKDGQRIVFRDYEPRLPDYKAQTNVHAVDDRKEELRALLSELRAEKAPVDPQWNAKQERLNEKRRIQEKIREDALAVCKRALVSRLFAPDAHFLIATLDEDIMRLQVLRVISSIVNGALRS